MATSPTTEGATISRERALLSRIGPIVVAICLLLDISLRLLPPRHLSFRAWEAMTLFAPGNGPFTPHSVYSSSLSSGDLASLGNLPHLRQFRQELFSTDAEGYRNRHEPTRPFNGILLVGDSFAAGSGVSDEQTLSEQLNRISGLPVYNGAEAPNFWELLHSLQMTGGLVVWLQSERGPLPLTLDDLSPDTREQSWRYRIVRSAIGDERTKALRRIKKYVFSLWSYSPLQILFGRAIKVLQNDKILPNPYRGTIVDVQLRNGREILFLPTELENYDRDRATNPQFFAQLKEQLQMRGIGLLVLLVPDKYVVYHDLLLPALPREKHPPFLNVVEQRLAAADVPVLNLTPRFRNQAQALLPRDEYLYWLDDSHWNAGGIRDAAAMIAESKAISQCTCR